MKKIIELLDVSYTYPLDDKSIRPALNNVNVSIYKGEKIALLGSNGAGKSTFFLIANGVITPDKGEIRIGGEEKALKKKDKDKLRKIVGLVFQEPEHQIIATRVDEEISFGAINMGFSKERVRENVENAMEMTNLSGYNKRGTHQLSGGEKKRLSIAGVLAMEPDLILFDEPTASLDNENIKAFKSTLEILSEKGISVVISTHDLDFAFQWADRGIVLKNGEIIADDEITGILENQELLVKAGLGKSILYELGKRVFSWKNPTELPKSLEEFKEAYNEKP